MRPVNQKRARGGRSGGRRGHMMGSHRNFDSSGPDIKIRGTANHIFDRYCQLARDANSSGDRIGAENYLQHAEHYYRIMLATGTLPQRQNGQPQQGQPQQGQGQAQPQGGNGGGQGPAGSGEFDGEGADGPDGAETGAEEAAV